MHFFIVQNKKWFLNENISVKLSCNSLLIRYRPRKFLYILLFILETTLITYYKNALRVPCTRITQTLTWSGNIFRRFCCLIHVFRACCIRLATVQFSNRNTECFIFTDSSRLCTIPWACHKTFKHTIYRPYHGNCSTAFLKGKLINLGKLYVGR